MRKLAGIIVIIFFTASVSCGRKNYSEIKMFINEVVAAQNEFLMSIQRSSNADDAVAAVNLFGDKLVKLSQKSMDIKKRYPEIDTWADNPPRELKSDLEKLDDPESEFEKVILSEKLKPVLRDKKVRNAFISLQEKMSDVKFFTN